MGILLERSALRSGFLIIARFMWPAIRFSIGVDISTVFLGFDHGFGQGLPILFETMIFGGPYDQWQRRYCTWDEAEAGHRHAVALATHCQWLGGAWTEAQA